MKALLIIFVIYINYVVSTEVTNKKLVVKRFPKKVKPYSNGQILINSAKYSFKPKSSPVKPENRSYTVFQVVGITRTIQGVPDSPYFPVDQNYDHKPRFKKVLPQYPWSLSVKNRERQKERSKRSAVLDPPSAAKNETNAETSTAKKVSQANVVETTSKADSKPEKKEEDPKIKQSTPTTQKRETKEATRTNKKEDPEAKKKTEPSEAKTDKKDDAQTKNKEKETDGTATNGKAKTKETSVGGTKVKVRSNGKDAKVTTVKATSKGNDTKVEAPNVRAKEPNVKKSRRQTAAKNNINKKPKQRKETKKKQSPIKPVKSKVPAKRSKLQNRPKTSKKPKATTAKRTTKKPKASRRLIAAREALIEDYPYVVSIQKNDQHWCSGALLNPRLVITTANCLWKANRMSRMEIRAGSRHVNRGGQMAGIQEVMKHPGWGLRKSPDNDVALILLDRNIRFSNAVHGVDLPNRVMLPPFEDAWVTSWGAERRDGVYDSESSTLQVYHTRLMDRAKCNNVTTRFSVLVTENFICLTQRGQTAPCTRDTGAPAVSDGILWGLASWGIRKLCGTERFPAMFSYLASHSNLDFITNATHFLMSDKRYYPFGDRLPMGAAPPGTSSSGE